MGVNQPDIDVVIHIGVPPTIECMVQEFGRAGQDGRQAEGKSWIMTMYQDIIILLFIYKGILLYSESDLGHADFWCKSNDPDDVLPKFQHTWRYVMHRYSVHMYCYTFHVPCTSHADYPGIYFVTWWGSVGAKPYCSTLKKFYSKRLFLGAFASEPAALPTSFFS